MAPIMHYLVKDELLSNELEAKMLQKHAEKYTMVYGKLYKMKRASFMLRCLGGVISPFSS